MDSVDYTFRFREKYLADQLNPEEKQAFEEELGRNPQLLEALKEQIYLGNMLGEFLGEEGESPSVESAIPPKEIRKPISVEMEQPGVLHRLFAEPTKMVAVIAFFLVCVWGIWFLSIPNKHKMLATNEFQHFSNKEIKGLSGTLGTQDPDDTTKIVPVDPLKLAAFTAYERGDFAGAYEKLTAFIETEKDSSGAALFYRGICAMETKQYINAQADFKKYQKGYFGGKYIADAMWYQSLAELQTGKPDEAKLRLAELAKKSVQYAGKAKRALGELGE